MTDLDWDAEVEISRVVADLLESDIPCEGVESETQSLYENGRYIEALELLIGRR